MICPCGGQTATWVNWPNVPLVNALPQLGGEAPTYDLDLRRCLACGTIQVANPPPAAVLFPPDYPYQSGPAFAPHAAQLARQLAMIGGRMLDVGSNDGTLVKAARDMGIHAVGLDASRPEAEIHGFFPHATRDWPGESWRLITALNVFAHIPDPLDFAAEAYRLLERGGIFVVEVSDLARVLAGARLDVLYHEHIWTWGRTGIVETLERVGFDIVTIDGLPAQGGAMRVWARKMGGQARYVVKDAPWHRVALFEEALAKWNLRISAIQHMLSDGARWVGYGAAAKGSMFAYHAKLGPAHLGYVVDETPGKQGRLTPYGVPIVPPERLAEDPPEGVLILAWNYATQIREKLRAFAGKVAVV